MGLDRFLQWTKIKWTIRHSDLMKRSLRNDDGKESDNDNATS